MEGVMAVVTCFAANFAPKNWAYCNGQTLPIAQNQALFSLLGTTYGGNGVTTFALPNLQSRIPVGTGQGAGLPNYTLGEMEGTENVTLTINNMPSHVHNGNVTLRLQADNTAATDTTPDFEYPSLFSNAYATTPTAGVTMMAPTIQATIAPTGGSQPVEVLSPYLGMNYVICMYGIFPSRN
ncbi:MAG: phage tail protein [Bacteroidia bacterium]